MTRNPVQTTKALVEVGDSSNLSVGAFGIDGEGRLVRKKETHRYDFQFSYLGFSFAVRADVSEPQTRMKLNGMLGHMPYTSEAPDIRANINAILATAIARLGGRIGLTQDQRILLRDEFVFDGALTPNNLLSKTVEFLLHAKPYLELVRMLASAADARSKAFQIMKRPLINDGQSQR